MGWTRKSGLPTSPEAPSEAEPGERLPVDSEPGREPAVSGPWLEIIDRLSALEAKEEDHHRRASHRESVIDQLHSQNEELLAGMRRGVLEPVVSDPSGCMTAFIAKVPGWPPWTWARPS